MGEHAKLSPSSATRWINCPGSVQMQEKAELMLGPEVTSEYAVAGSAAHALAEHCLNLDTDPLSHIGDIIYTDDYGIPHEVTEEMCHKVINYLEVCRKQDGDQYIEQKVSLAPALPDVWGTADFVSCRPGKLFVCDLKTGQGHRVEAQDNWQLIIYGIGAWLMFDALYDFEEITIAVSQPPLNHYSEWTLTKAELMVWAQKLKEAVVAINQNSTDLSASEPACRWCRARSFCPAIGAEVEAARQRDYKEMMLSDLSEAMTKVPLVKAWIKGVEDAMKQTLLENGESIEGWKVVHGRQARKWKDEDTAVKYLKRRVPKFQHNFCTLKFMSPAQVEKKLKLVEPRKPVDLDSLIETVPGKPTIAPDSDKREAMVLGDKAADDFAGLDDDK